MRAKKGRKICEGVRILFSLCLTEYALCSDITGKNCLSLPHKCSSLIPGPQSEDTHLLCTVTVMSTRMFSTKQPKLFMGRSAEDQRHFSAVQYCFLLRFCLNIETSWAELGQDQHLLGWKKLNWI